MDPLARTVSLARNHHPVIPPPRAALPRWNPRFVCNLLQAPHGGQLLAFPPGSTAGASLVAWGILPSATGWRERTGSATGPFAFPQLSG
eukprot:14751128-Alexandrium_andersonii.AAC.1